MERDEKQDDTAPSWSAWCVVRRGRREFCRSRVHYGSRRHRRHRRHHRRRRCRRLGRDHRRPRALASRIGSRCAGHGRGTEERTPRQETRSRRAPRTAGRTRRMRNRCADSCTCWSGVSNSQAQGAGRGLGRGTTHYCDFKQVRAWMAVLIEARLTCMFRPETEAPITNRP